MIDLRLADCRPAVAEIEDNSVDAVITDPPYGIGFNYASYDDNPDDYLDLVRWIVRESNRVVKPGGMVFVFQGTPRLRDTLSLFPEGSRIFAACKNWVQMRPTEVQYSYDPVVFWKKPGKYLRKPHGRDFFISNTSPSGRGRLDNVNGHPCPRPLDVMLYLVYNFTLEGGTVLDPFMGSGSTGVACVLQRRDFIGIEISEDYFVEAERRISETQRFYEMGFRLER